MPKNDKNDKKAKDKVKQVMKDFKEGNLKTGTGKAVTDIKQAIAIGLSEAKEAGEKILKPKKKKK